MNKRKIRKDIVNIGLHNYATRLMNEGFSLFKKYSVYRESKKIRLMKIYIGYLKKIALK